jgi:hypothetical protein
MRKLALMALAAGVLATAAIPASAATLVEDFDFLISPDSSTNADYDSTTFAGFDPSLGTLNTVTISITGSLTWVPGSPIGHDPPSIQTLRLILVTPVSAFQMVSSPNDVSKDFDVDLNGAGAFIGSGPQQAVFAVTDDSDGVFEGAHVRLLTGVATYTFTPATPAVPESSTWAMMLVGFAGLGYAAARRRGAVRAIFG